MAQEKNSLQAFMNNPYHNLEIGNREPENDEAVISYFEKLKVKGLDAFKNVAILKHIPTFEETYLEKYSDAVIDISNPDTMRRLYMNKPNILVISENDYLVGEFIKMERYKNSSLLSVVLKTKINESYKVRKSISEKHGLISIIVGQYYTNYKERSGGPMVNKVVKFDRNNSEGKLGKMSMFEMNKIDENDPLFNRKVKTILGKINSVNSSRISRLPRLTRKISEYKDPIYVFRKNPHVQLEVENEMPRGAAENLSQQPRNGGRRTRKKSNL